MTPRRIGVLAYNSPAAVALFRSCAAHGITFVPFNARLTRAELAPLVELANVSCVYADEALRDRIEGSLPLPLSWPRFEGPRPSDDQPLAALFTSGTTGTPRLIELTHGNFRASARASAGNLGGGPDQRWLLCLPIFHIGGLAMVHRCAEYGATLLIENGFDPDRVNALIDAGEVTHTSFVTTALDRLMERRTTPFPSTLRAILVGGGPVPRGSLDRARALGAPVLQTYGLTEACSQVTTERPGDADGATAGWPLPGVELRIIEGQIEVRGPTVARQFGGWLKTGDLGTLDDRGRLTVLSRRTDLIVSGGENVYPAELERVLAEHPEVREVAVTASPDKTWGQVPVAVVVWRGAPAGDAVTSWCRSRLAGFKLPRRFISAETLPRNANGKVDRAQLRALAG
jgi:O-succinylbenzoic acid--CoA ligase